MSEAAAQLLPTVAYSAIWLAAGVSIVGWGLSVYYGYKAARCTLQEARPWGSETLFNPLNALLFGRLLSPEGQEYRRKMLRALLVFAVPIALVAVALLVVLLLVEGVA